MTSDEPIYSAEETDARAANWLARLDREEHLDGSTTLDVLAERVPEFGDWIDESVAHRVSFLRLFSTWQRTHRLAALKGSSKAPIGVWRRRRAIWAGALAACFALTIVGLTVLSAPPRQPEPDIQTYATAIGDSREVTLADGTSVHLNSSTQLTVSLTPDDRRVMLLSGEAFFDVSPDPGRPFKVIAGNGTVEVLGTSFSVERRDDLVEVLVTEGIVTLEGPSSAAGREMLRAGMAGYADSRGVIVEAVGVEAIGDRLLWREGRLRFDATPLSEVAAEFNRYNDIQLVIADETTGEIRIGGTFPLDEVEAFVRLAEHGLGLKVRRDRDTIRIGSK